MIYLFDVAEFPMTSIGVTYKGGSIWRNLIIIHFCNMRHITKWFQITGEKLQKKTVIRYLPCTQFVKMHVLLVRAWKIFD
jgi:hypothetical protein